MDKAALRTVAICFSTWSEVASAEGHRHEIGIALQRALAAIGLRDDLDRCCVIHNHYFRHQDILLLFLESWFF